MGASVFIQSMLVDNFMSICFCIYLLHLTSISNFDSRWWNDILEILSFQTKYDQWIQWKIHHSALIFELIKSPAKIDTLPRYSWPAGPGPPWPKAITRNIYTEEKYYFQGSPFQTGTRRSGGKCIFNKSGSRSRLCNGPRGGNQEHYQHVQIVQWLPAVLRPRLTSPV